MRNLIIAGASFLLVSSFAFASTNQNDVLGSLPAQSANVTTNNSATVTPSVNASGTAHSKKAVQKRHRRHRHHNHTKNAANPNQHAK